MSQYGIFNYITISHNGEIQIGFCTSSNNCSEHHNGVKDDAVDSLSVCHLPHQINGYRVTQLGYRAISNIDSLPQYHCQMHW